MCGKLPPILGFGTAFPFSLVVSLGFMFSAYINDTTSAVQDQVWVEFKFT